MRVWFKRIKQRLGLINASAGHLGRGKWPFGRERERGGDPLQHPKGRKSAGRGRVYMAVTFLHFNLRLILQLIATTHPPKGNPHQSIHRQPDLRVHCGRCGMAPMLAREPSAARHYSAKQNCAA
jgi:hypothetical protein